MKRKIQVLVTTIAMGVVMAASVLSVQASTRYAVNVSASNVSVTLEEAKAIALEHAGLDSDEVTFTKVKLDWDDGIHVYEIEWYTDSFVEYEYEIHASTGAILDFDCDREEHYRHSQSSSLKPAVAEVKISADQAKSVVFEKAGVSESQVSKLKVKLDSDDGRMIYEIEFRTAKLEYEAEVDASTGEVLAWEVDSD
ncbi:MAG: PepSY domain-containing protein [Clostridiales bacterium]|nr:PepSY domain-containing protein [Clostridiales bacterium]